MNNLVAIVGMCGSGKSVATDFFKNKGYETVYFGGVTMRKLKEANMDITPENEKMMREKLRKDLGMGAYAIVLKDEIKQLLQNNNVVLDGVYSWSEVKILNEKFQNMVIIAIVADKKIRYERLKNRKIRPFTEEEANYRDISEIENLEKGGSVAYADYFILNNGNIDEYNKKLSDIYEIIEKRN